MAGWRARDWISHARTPFDQPGGGDADAGDDCEQRECSEHDPEWVEGVVEDVQVNGREHGHG